MTGGIYLILIVIAGWIAALIEERKVDQGIKEYWHLEVSLKERERRLAKGATDFTWLPEEIERERQRQLWAWFPESARLEHPGMFPELNR